MKNLTLQKAAFNCCVLLLLFSTGIASAQSGTWNGKPVYKELEIMPVYGNGERDLMEFLSANIKYPSVARKKDITGKVTATFIIDEKGILHTPEILSGIGGGCDEETLRVIKLLPNKWSPGMKDGKPVAVQMSLPVIFRL